MEKSLFTYQSLYNNDVWCYNRNYLITVYYINRKHKSAFILFFLSYFLLRKHKKFFGAVMVLLQFMFTLTCYNQTQKHNMQSSVFPGNSLLRLVIQVINANLIPHSFITKLLDVGSLHQNLSRFLANLKRKIDRMPFDL